MIYFFKNETFNEESIKTMKKIYAFFRCETEISKSCCLNCVKCEGLGKSNSNAEEDPEVPTDKNESNSNSEVQMRNNDPQKEKFIQNRRTSF